jgi:hypothetical protein
MELTNVIACVNENHAYLVPCRLSLPSFLPKNQTSAKRMCNDLLEGYVNEAWLIDEEEEELDEDKASHFNHNQIKSVLRQGVDWESCRVLEYDFDEPDGYGGFEHEPFSIWNDVQEVIKGREHQPSLVPFLNDKDRVESYAKYLSKEAWASWSMADLMKQPCWMFYYAKNVCRGRLPDVLDNCMNFQDSENPWVKRYFSTKRYRSRNRKALASIPWAA